MWADERAVQQVCRGLLRDAFPEASQDRIEAGTEILAKAALNALAAGEVSWQIAKDNAARLHEIFETGTAFSPSN